MDRKTFLGAMVVLAGLVAFSVWSGREPRVQAQGGGEPSALPPSLTVVGEGHVDAAPDIAYLATGVQTTAETAQDAQRANAERMQAVVGSIRALGIEERDLQTSGLTLGPVTNREQQITGYRAQNTLTVTVRDLSQTGAVYDAAVAAGANVGGHFRFGFSNDAELQRQALAAAVVDARERAGTTAQAAGVSLGAIRSIGEEGISIPQPRIAMPAVGAPAQMEQTTPVQPGEQRVTARVRIVFDL